MTEWKTMSRDERIDAINDVLATSPRASARQIGAKIGSSRDAVLGMAFRYPERIPGLTRIVAPPKKRADKSRKLSSRSTDVLVGKIGAAMAGGLSMSQALERITTKPEPLPHDPAFDPLPGTTPKTLTDLAAIRHDGSSPECHWPVGDSPILFCGCATRRGRYCPTHEKMSGKRVRFV